MADSLTNKQLYDEFTLDEDFDNLIDKDSTTEIVGYVVHVIAPAKVGKTVKKFDLFKFVLSNDRNCRIMCLIWGIDLIKQYQTELTINRVVHLNGALTKAALMNTEKTSLGVLPFEIVITKSTTVKYLGIYLAVAETETSMVNQVNFDSVKNAVDQKISIEGYIKTPFAQSSTMYDSMTYGYGAITDGTSKITVQIGNYVPLTIEKGVYVTVVGNVVNLDGLLKISCKNSSDITPDMEHEQMPAAQVKRGTKQVTVPKRSCANQANE